MTVFEEVLETVQALSRMTPLEPRRVARVLGMRARLLNSRGEWRDFVLDGGAGEPFAVASSAWSTSGKGAVTVGLAAGLNLAMPKLLESLGSESHFRPSDPRIPKGRHRLIFRVPVGELTLLFPGFDDQFVLDSFVVSQTPQLAWRS